MTQTEIEQRTGYEVARLDDMDAQGGWLPIRKNFDVGAFGVNAWRPKDDGEIIGEHDEKQFGHEELYVVLEGHATFTLDGDEVDAPAGSLVFVRDSAVRRKAVARETGTTILAVGGAPGQAYSVAPWEANAEIFPLFARGEFTEAKRRLQDAVERHPDAGTLFYNLACAEARLGETDAALDHLQRAVELSDQFGEYAKTDEDLAAIRDDPRFPA